MKSSPAMDRILEHLKKHESGCWTLGDYGGDRAIVRFRGKNFSARTLLWEQIHGEVPDGRQLRVSCRDKKCVNPAHCRVASGTMEQRIQTWSEKHLNGCIVWNGTVGRDGYGLIRHLGRNFPAHRVAYQLEKGPIPEGLLVCHKCDNPPCVNVEHLFLGTPQANATDMVEKGRSNCGTDHHAHKLTPKEVLDIRERFSLGENVASLAKAFGMSYSAMTKVVDRITWKQVHGQTQ